MDLLTDIQTKALTFIPVLLTLTGVLIALGLLDRFLGRRWRNQHEAAFRFKLTMLVLTLVGGLAVVIALPVSDALRAQLLSLIGILLSAAIAFSSTTFIGNMMAGIMIRVIKSIRPGDFITIDQVTGRVTEIDLLHTEVQTEDRDLITVPNLFMVTRPMQVVRSTGTLVAAEVSLGYDVSRFDISELLNKAAEKAGLSDAFVHVRDLGDFSVLYRVSGLLLDVKSLISTRSRLRECMLDALHEAGIEIVSPTIMTTRALDPKSSIRPQRNRKSVSKAQNAPEDLAFDKAEEAASIEEIRQLIVGISARIKEEKSSHEDLDALKDQKQKLEEQLQEAETRRKEAEQSG